MGGIKLESMQAEVQQMIRNGALVNDPWGGMGEQFWVSKPGTAFHERLLRKVDSDRLFRNLADAWPSVTSNQGDVVNVAPGHTETLTGAGGLTIAKSGFSVKGHGIYDLRPNILMDEAAASCLITGSNLLVDNMRFRAGHADLAYFALITGKGVTLSRIALEENVATENFVIGFSVGAADNDADGFQAIGCSTNGVDSAATNFISLNKNLNDVKILGNYIVGDFGTTPFAPIYAPSTEIMLNIEVAYNVIFNDHDQDAVVGVSIANTASTGTIHHNLCSALDVAGATPFLAGAGGLTCFENYYIFESTTSAYIMPTVGTPA